MNNKIKKNITCFSSHEKFNVNCNKKNCRYYLEYPDHQNCVINMSKDKKYTMQKIGEIFNITRMRVCQIEKNTLKKLNKLLS